MEFKNASQKECYEKISPWMEELFGVTIKVHPERPSYFLQVGSSYTVIQVLPWKEESSVIRAMCCVVTHPEVNAELMEFLLKTNNKLIFGGFLLDDDNDIWIQQTINGSTVDKEELKHCVLSIAITADKLDDEIIQKWGGERGIDRKAKG
jgi:hypothetical protein